jgi:hypothetical protein
VSIDINPDAGYVAFGNQLQGNLTPFQLADLGVVMTDADLTLSSAQYQIPVLTLTGTLTAGRNVIVPTTPKGLWIVTNSTTGGFAVTVKTSAGTGIAVANGKTAMVRTDGTNVIRVTGDI